MKLHSVRPPSGEGHIIGEEPSWEKAKNTPYELVRAFGWYSYCTDVKAHRKFLVEWVHLRRPETSAKDLKIIDRIPDKHLTGSIPALARIILRGFPATQEQIDKVWAGVLEMHRVAQEDGEEKKTTPRQTVWDHVTAAVTPFLGELDDYTDTCLCGTRIPLADAILEMTHSEGWGELKGPHLSIIRKYLKRHLVDFEILRDSRRKDCRLPDDQLLEAYKYLSNKRLDTIIDSFGLLLGVIETKTQDFKTQRVRKKKPRDKAKVVSKVKYLKEGVGFTSESPLELIGANEVWAYDTKTRKLSVYIAQTEHSIYVTGTSLHGWDAEQSGQWTIRKPEEQMAAFKKLRKNQLHKWLGALTTKKAEVAGRLNANTLLLRILN